MLFKVYTIHLNNKTTEFASINDPMHAAYILFLYWNWYLHDSHSIFRRKTCMNENSSYFFHKGMPWMIIVLIFINHIITASFFILITYRIRPRVPRDPGLLIFILQFFFLAPEAVHMMNSWLPDTGSRVAHPPGSMSQF